MKKLCLVRFVFICLLLFYSKFLNAQWNRDSLFKRNNFFAVDFWDSNNGCVAGSSLLFTTTNGGNTWVLRDTGGFWLANERFDVQYLSSNRIVAAGWEIFSLESKIFLSNDGGTSWQTVYSGPDFEEVQGIHFPTPTTGYAITTDGYVLKSTNGGSSWSTQAIIPETDVFLRIYFTDTNTGYIFGNINKLYKTTDGGSTWIKTDLDYKIMDIYFVDNNNGYRIGDKFQKTTDGGVTWVDLNLPIGGIYSVIECKDFNYCQVLTNNGLLRTRDGFATLEKAKYYGYDIKYAGNDSWFIAGGQGQVYKTINGGGDYYPIATFKSDTTEYCFGDTVHLKNYSNPALTFQWFINGKIKGSTYDFYFAFDSVGYNKVSLVVDNGSLKDTSTISLNIKGLPNIYSPNFVPYSSTVCSGSSTKFTLTTSTANIYYELYQDTVLLWSVAPPLSYSYSINTNPILDKTNFILQEKRTDECGTKTRLDTFIIPIFPKILINPNIKPSDSMACYGEEKEIIIPNSQQGIQYSFYLGSSTNPATYYGSGDTFVYKTASVYKNLYYTLKLRDQYYCEIIHPNNFTIYLDSVSSKFEFDKRYKFVGDTLTLFNHSYNGNQTWLFPPDTNIVLQNDTLIKITFLQPGYKTFESFTTTSHGCSDTTRAVFGLFEHGNVSNGMICSNEIDTSVTGDRTIFKQHLDEENNLYVTGFFSARPAYTTTYNLFVIKYDENGKKIWQYDYDYNYYTVDYYSTYGLDLTTDSEGNVYVCGSFAGRNIKFGNIHYVKDNNVSASGYILKLDQSGNVVWCIFGIGSISSSYIQSFTNIVKTHDNKFYCSFYGDPEFLLPDSSVYSGTVGGNFHIIEFDANGMISKINSDLSQYFSNASNRFIPSTDYIYTGQYTNLGPNMHFYENGQLYISGYLNGGKITIDTISIEATTWERDGFVAVFDTTDFKCLSLIKTIGNNWDVTNSRPLLCTYDAEGNIYVAATWFRGVSSPSEYQINPALVLEKYNMKGNQLWSIYNPHKIFLRNISYNNKSLLMFGTFGDQVSSINSWNECNIKFNTYYSWCKSNFMGLSSVDKNPVGMFSTGDKDAFIASYSSTGNIEWLQTIGGNKNNEAQDMMIDPCGKMYLASAVEDTVLFNNNTYNHVGYDLMYTQFSPTGNCTSPCNPSPFDTLTVSNTEFCSGNSISITYSIIDTVNILSGNQFFALLSDENGLFNSPDTLGSVFSSSKDGVINGTIPYGIRSGNKYKIRIITTSPKLKSSPTKEFLTIYSSTIQRMKDKGVCKGRSTELKADLGQSYLWTPSTTLSSATIQNPIASPITNTNYIVKITNLCGDFYDTVNVFINQPPVITLKPRDTISCGGKSILLSASGGVTYSWDPYLCYNPNDSITYTKPFTSNVDTHYFVVTVTDSNLCSSKDSVRFVLRDLSNVNLVNDTTYCSTITISINNTWKEYKWSTGATTSSVILSTAGNYSITVTDNYGCTISDQFNLTKQSSPSPYFSFSYINYNKVQFTGSYNSTYTYTWDFGDGSSGASIYNPIHTYQNKGTYKVRLTVMNECSGMYYEDEVIIDPSGVYDIQELNKIKIYPNPFTKQLSIELPHQNFKFLELNFYDLTGKLVFQNPDKFNFNLINIFEVNTLSKGAYYLKINTDKGSVTRKIFVF